MNCFKRWFCSNSIIKENQSFSSSSSSNDQYTYIMDELRSLHIILQHIKNDIRHLSNKHDEIKREIDIMNANFMTLCAYKHIIE